jgi:hypothetical protein
MGSFSASAQINEVMRQVKEKLQARSSSVMQMFHSMDKVRRALAHSPSRPIDSTSAPRTHAPRAYPLPGGTPIRPSVPVPLPVPSHLRIDPQDQSQQLSRDEFAACLKEFGIGESAAQFSERILAIPTHPKRGCLLDACLTLPPPC